MRLGACTGAQSIDFALVHIDSVALRWAEGQVFHSWDAFVNAFHDRFCQADEDAIVQQLQQVRQDNCQDVGQLADLIRTLCGQVAQIFA